MPSVLKDKIAIITGGGRGIGRAFALRFADEGAKLVLADINLEWAEAVVKEIGNRGGDALALKVDISNESDTQMMAEKAKTKYGRVDILINNAALLYVDFLAQTGHKPWNFWTVEQWDRVFAVNVRGTWLCCKAIVPFMKMQSRGKIINITSSIINCISPAAGRLLHYTCTKAAIYTMTQALARELGADGINVNAIAPGLTATEGALTMPDRDPDGFNKLIAAQCIHRREEPEDIVGTAVFLASEDSDFITGQVIAVDGGLWLK